ncbi:hypothetical protein PROFUN_00588 [Planoprotostelium fungivorum]|uniref:Uncharacterized protein n=1 Tax=Planoprotostelium fungivorum TaxID=1890364 RepID=A0A2P6N189_9EUKA|nr:hypothetical protein PROFUN_00588 [Planoprotostelium fungivorum]
MKANGILVLCIIGIASSCVNLLTSSGTIDHKASSADNCWLLKPDYGVRRQAQTIQIRFSTFNFSQNTFLRVYSGNSAQFPIAAYSNTSISIGTGGPGEDNIIVATHGGSVLIAIDGQGLENTFIMEYSVARVFFGLIAALGAPCIFSCWTCTPCATQWFNPKKRRRMSLVTYILGGLIGGVLGGIFLAIASGRVNVPDVFGMTKG